MATTYYNQRAFVVDTSTFSNLAVDTKEIFNIEPAFHVDLTLNVQVNLNLLLQDFTIKRNTQAPNAGTITTRGERIVWNKIGDILHTGTTQIKALPHPAQGPGPTPPPPKDNTRHIKEFFQAMGVAPSNNMKVDSNQFVAYVEGQTGHSSAYIRSIFDRMDTNGDGYVTSAEMKAAVTAGKFSLPPQSQFRPKQFAGLQALDDDALIQNLFRAMGATAATNLTINSNQFVAYLQGLTGYSLVYLQDLFDQMDADGDGLVNAAEMKAAIAAGNFTLPHHLSIHHGNSAVTSALHNCSMQWALHRRTI